MNNKTKQVVFAALIAAIYGTLTIVFAPISYGPIQLRVAEGLTILPFFNSFSILGLFIGCIIANIAGGLGIIDIIFGSLATLLAAIITYYIGKSSLKYKRYLAPLPSVIVNAIVVGLILKYTLNLPLLLTILQVGFGQFIACYAIGLPLLMGIEKNSKLLNYFK